MTDEVALPKGQKTFKINEVCKLADVQPYMLRFWGTEFEELQSTKTGTGQRQYTRKQVEVILEIRRLLFDEGLTIAGARKRLRAIAAGEAEPTTAARPRGRQAAPAASASPAAPAAGGEVDKTTPDRVKPLLTALRGLRTEVAQIVEDLKRTKVGT
jgi:DNA-binding transcriptional MerR regulator